MDFVTKNITTFINQNIIFSKPGFFTGIVMGKVVILFFLLTSVQAKCQPNSKLFFNEFTLWGNRTMLYESNTENRNGFGLGIYRSIRDSSAMRLVFGVEFNKTELFRKKIPGSHLHYSRDVTITYNNVSIPVSARLFPLNNIALFLEAGLFLDLIVSKRKKGTFYEWRPSQADPPGYMHASYEEIKFGYSGADFGFSGGLGYIIKVRRCSLVVKADYKYGLKSQFLDNTDFTNRYIRLMAGLKL